MEKNIRKNNGFIITDAVISVITILIFSTIILSSMYNNQIENLKVKMNGLATMYFTEIFENIGIANYDEVTSENIMSFVPEELRNSEKVKINISVNTIGESNILKKIIATISFNIVNKEYTYTMERMKSRV